MSPRPDVSEERKQQILEAAMTVFSRLGFHQARMDDIVEEAGLSKGTLYWYFKGGKDDIILALLDNMLASELADLQKLQVSEDSASESLMKFMQRTLTDVKRLLDLMPLTYEFYALALRDEAVQQSLRHFMRKYLDALIPIIQNGIEKGEFRSVNAEDIAIAISAILEGTLLLWIYDPEIINLDRHPEASMRLFLEGLQIKPSVK